MSTVRSTSTGPPKKPDTLVSTAPVVTLWAADILPKGLEQAGLWATPTSNRNRTTIFANMKGTTMYTIIVGLTGQNCKLCRWTGVVEAKSVEATERGLQVTLLNGEVYQCRLLPEEVDLHFEWSGR